MQIEEGKKEYEIGFVLKDENAAPILAALKKYNFTLVQENPLQKIRFSYPIKKETQGFFSYVLFTGAMEGIKGLSEDLKLNKDVLRFLILAAPERVVVKEKSSAEVASGPTKTVRSKREPSKKSYDGTLTNEALEKTLEEISK